MKGMGLPFKNVLFLWGESPKVDLAGGVAADDLVALVGERSAKRLGIFEQKGLDLCAACIPDPDRMIAAGCAEPPFSIEASGNHPVRKFSIRTRLPDGRMGIRF